MVTDGRTDGQTRRVAAPPICGAPPRHADRHAGQPAAVPGADAAAALGVARPGIGESRLSSRRQNRVHETRTRRATTTRRAPPASLAGVLGLAVPASKFQP